MRHAKPSSSSRIVGSTTLASMTTTAAAVLDGADLGRVGLRVRDAVEREALSDETGERSRRLKRTPVRGKRCATHHVVVVVAEPSGARRVDLHPGLAAAVAGVGGREADRTAVSLDERLAVDIGVPERVEHVLLGLAAVAVGTKSEGKGGLGVVSL